jgi:hypothetical protein
MEDFFKRRFPDQKLESRTIGAFITAGMLPRLQMLRENKWILFILSTNSKLNDLDDAVTRLGRFDFYHEMEHPTTDAQIRYVNRKLNEIQSDLPGRNRTRLLSVLTDTLKMRSEVPDASPLPFQVLDRLVNNTATLAIKQVPNPNEVIAILRNLLDEKAQRSLVKPKRRRQRQ